ncbi:hypothetical protein VNO77_44479 [Canavalia gladiata]|uniref:RNase H type-1 domain-containing protein n=1 Tax=Canavalia gladiata TaxID=3824 RepID=A0AAN9JZ13_CANGL
MLQEVLSPSPFTFDDDIPLQPNVAEETSEFLQRQNVEIEKCKSSSFDPLVPMFFPGLGCIKVDREFSDSWELVAAILSLKKKMEIGINEPPLEINKGMVGDLKKCTTEDKPGTPHAAEECSFAPVEIADSLQGHNVETVTDKHNNFNFNPLAPLFFPGIGFKKDDRGSGDSCETITTNLWPKKEIVMKTVVMDSPMKLNEGTERDSKKCRMEDKESKEKGLGLEKDQLADVKKLECRKKKLRKHLRCDYDNSNKILNSGIKMKKTKVIWCTWRCPPNGWVCLNTDGSVYDKKRNGRIGSACGGLIRDSTGCFLGGFNVNLGSISSVTLAELWGVVHGLKLAWDIGWKKVKVDIDSTNALALVRNSTVGNDDVTCALVSEINDLVRKDWLVEFSHVFRESNRAADRLAHLGHSNSPRLGVKRFLHAPRILAQVLQDDLAGVATQRGHS